MNQKPTKLETAIGDRFVVLIGLMGAGKTNMGRRLSAATGIPFVDTDEEVEKAAGCTIPEIFQRFGEEEFRSGERRVIARVLSSPPAIVATGGGAFMDQNTRALFKKNAISVWLRANLDTLVKRTARRKGRPLLNNGKPREVLQSLMDERYPVYGEADIIVDVGDEDAEQTAARILNVINDYLGSIKTDTHK
ncbi:MAG: shikimate kinase [Rhodospirillales bacterium]|nr:shikimate kinase [Rhodospirillales bacterium]